jgi:hypothetical protein
MTLLLGQLDEGEEVFIDGFREMVIKENSAYKNSFQKRAEANLLIDEIRSQLLTARGLPEGNSRYSIGNINQSLKNLVMVLVALDQNKIHEITIFSLPVCINLQQTPGHSFLYYTG